MWKAEQLDYNINMVLGIAPYLQTKTLLVKTAMGFFDSEIVQNEAKQLFTDYQNLVNLGSNYGKFDRDGKKMFIDQMEELMDRYKIFMKRFELSDDFMAQMTVQQMNTQLGQFGMTPQQMFDQMRVTLDRMKSEIKE